MAASLADLRRRAHLAEAIARRAGVLALASFQTRADLLIEAKRHAQDMVTEADRQVETLIREAIAADFPQDALLGEEHGTTPGTSGLTWAIDPIDGTAPFLAGLPGWCISIGAVDDGGPAVGVIYAPVLDEMFVAARGLGATLNGVPVRVTHRFDLRSGLLGIGANDRVDAGQVGRMLADLSLAGASWTRYGSGALMLAWVAAGRLVGYAEPRMSAWDCMAGYCLVQEAGGRVLPFPGGAELLRPAPVLGARPGVYEELLSTTRLDQDAVWGPRR
jgi:myo-inositol-1(or 4)-monophosphatase